MSTKGFLGDLLPGVLNELAVENKKRKYREDFDLWVREFMGLQVWSKQREIAASVRDNRYTAVAAGHSVGKSYVAGLIACWWVDTHPWNEADTFVATTAPSKDQVDLIWGYIRGFHQLSQRRFEEGLTDHAMPGYITGDNKYKLSNGQMLGQGRKPPDSKSDIAFQGRHATYLLAIGDEATGLSQGFLNALGVIATGSENRILLIANPVDPGSAMARLWPDPEGRGGNPDWVRMHISVKNGPLFTHEPGFDTSKATGMSGPEFVEWAKNEYGGEEDARYVARVLGEWAWDNGVGMFPEEVLSKAMRTVVIPDPDFPRARFGVDVARAGVDSTQVYECRVGRVWEVDEDTGEPKVETDTIGLHIRYVDHWNKVAITSSNPEHPGTAQRLDKLAREFGVEVVNIDAAGGLGVGVFDAIMEVAELDGIQRDYYVYEVFGGDVKGVDRRAFINLRAFMFSELKRRMAAGEIDLDPEDKDLFDELRGIRAKITGTGAIQIESKEDMKKRGAKSPDRADALWYAALDSLDTDSGPRPGDIIKLDPDDLLEDSNHFWFGSKAGLNQTGW